jgi:protocatechuate 3,4-dioxygenase beta subunit
MKRRTFLATATLVLGSRFAGSAPRERVLGPCEGCDWVYDDMPSSLAAVARIAPTSQPGTQMIIDGVVRGANGKPAPDVIVYAYHTDVGGLYPAARNRHGSIKGWARTDAQGRYRFDTIRPGAYPSRNVAEHVHMHVIEPGVGTYYIDNLEFRDDPLQSGRAGEGRGGSGLMLPERRDGVWHARRDIELGRAITGHPSR